MMPHSLEMEMSVLGSMILQPRAIHTCQSILTHKDFFRSAHQLIFVAITDLVAKGRAVDLILLRDSLESVGCLQLCGGEDYLIQVADFVPSASHAESYALIVREHSERRERIESLKKTLELAQDMERPLDEVRAAMSSFEVIRGSESPFTEFKDIPIRSERRRGVSTGFPSVDRKISTDGYPSGQMSIVSAYHKGRKTSWLLSSLVEQLHKGRRSLFATFADLGAEDLKERMVRHICGWGREPALQYAQEEFHAAVRLVNEKMSGGIYDASALDSGGDIETFCAWFRAEHSKQPFDCAFLDYAQEITSIDKRASFGEMALANVVSQKIVQLAKKVKIPFVVAAQITEGSEKQGTKTKTKGSRVWEERAGWVLRLTPDADVEIEFSRFGEQGLSVPMKWNNVHLRFEDPN